MSSYCRIAIVCLTLLATAVPQRAELAPVPDTGQTRCTDSENFITCPAPGQPFYGQDANYLINTPSYTKLNGNGNALPNSAASWSMVKDDVTGLIWEIKINKDGNVNYADPHDADNMYTWYDGNAGTNGGNAGTPGGGTDTEDFIKALNDAKFGGFVDWRLPTVSELTSIINYGHYDPSIDTGYFNNTVSYYYWTSTTEVHDPSHAWSVSFSYSYVLGNGKEYKYYARAVRGVKSVPVYVNNGNGTVTDTNTGLMWELGGVSDKTWEQALGYCEGLTLAGHTDWRLPTIKEIRSLIDYDRENPAIDITFFPDTESAYYWSSTPSSNVEYYGWGLDFGYGEDSNGHKSDQNFVRAVRGGQAALLGNLVVFPDKREVAKAAGTTTLDVSNSGTGTMTWTASVTSGGDWLRITSGSGGTNAGTITCAYDANTGAAFRTASLRVAAAGVNGSPVDITVTQAGAVTPTPTPTPLPILSISPTSKSIPKETGTFPIAVSNTGTGSMSWAAAVISGGTWLSISSGSSGTNTGIITCAYSSNTSTSHRTATVQVTAAGAAGSPNYVTITQTGTINSVLSPIPDTGQTKCYNVVGNPITCPSPGQALYGQDANYTINPMSYTKLDANGNALPDSAASWAMIRDNVTGLIWEMKTNFDWAPNYNDFHDADNAYAWYDSNPATNGGNAGNPNDGINTEAFIEYLNKTHYGTYSDWRLPTFKELTYIVNFGLASPGPTIMTKYFSSMPPEYFWTSTTNANYPDYAWGVHFYYGGYDNHHNKYYGNHAVAVRGGLSGSSSQSVTHSAQASTGDFVENEDASTVTDTTTGLIWQKAASTTKMSWEQALAHCENLDLAGFTDWRMPTIKELRRLVDYSKYNPSIDPAIFPNTLSSVYWSSTTYENSTNGAWGIDFYNGHEDSYDKDEAGYYVRAVRGGNPAALSHLVVTPTSRNAAAVAGTTSFAVSNNGEGTMLWTAVVTTGTGWLRITSGASGTNTGTITCAFDANSTTASRTGKIRITAAGSIDSPMDVSVVQAASPTPTPTPTPTPAPSQFLGVWSDGVWSWDITANKWTLVSSTAGAQMIAAGKVDSDSVDDLIGVWPSGLYVRFSGSGQWLKLSTSLPTWIAAGDLTNDGRDDVIVSWKNDGVYYRDSATGKWVKISTAALKLATGDIGGKNRDDLAGVWSDGLWVRYSTDASWKKIDPAIPIWIAVGNISGDKQADIAGSYSSGTWYRNSATGAWTKITTPAEQLAAGDIDGDGRDDLIGIWSNKVYVRYGATGQWQQITASKPKWIAAGRIAAAIQAAGSLDDPMVTGAQIHDLSQDGDRRIEADIVDLMLR